MKLLADLKDLAKQIHASDVFLISQNIAEVVSIWNPMVGMMIGTILRSAEYTYNEESQNKLKEKIEKIIALIQQIIEDQKSNQTNFEAMIICPDIFKKVLITEDREKTEYLLHLIKMLFEAGKVNYDEIDEAIRIIGDLSINEYKVLKLVPEVPTTWENVFRNEEMRKFKESLGKEYLQILLRSLFSKGLISVNTPSIHDGKTGSIRFDHSSETICLSIYGDKFIKTLNTIEVE